MPAPRKDGETRTRTVRTTSPVTARMPAPRKDGETRTRTVRTTSPVTARMPAPRKDGETRTRTGDTTVFSRVLYQLSYLALRGDAIGWGARRIARGTGKRADLVSPLPECAAWACSRSFGSALLARRQSADQARSPPRVQSRPSFRISQRLPRWYRHRDRSERPCDLEPGRSGAQLPGCGLRRGVRRVAASGPRNHLRHRHPPVVRQSIMLGFAGSTGTSSKALAIEWVTKDARALASLVTSSAFQTARTYDGATLYLISSLTVAIYRATVLLGTTQHALMNALDRHSRGAGITKAERKSATSRLPPNTFIGIRKTLRSPLQPKRGEDSTRAMGRRTRGYARQATLRHKTGVDLSSLLGQLHGRPGDQQRRP